MVHKEIKNELLRLLGISAIVLSIILTVSSGILTGNIIIEKVLSDNFKVLGIILFLGGIVLLAITRGDGHESGTTLEERAYADNEAHNLFNGINLKNRLAYMERTNTEGVGPGVKHGNYLNINEEDRIREIILNGFRTAVSHGEISKEVLEKDLEISVSGSLSKAKKGVREPHKKVDDIEWSLNGMKSDQFYVSDIDISIAGKGIFDYITARWPTAIKHGGENSGQSTYEIAEKEFLTDRELKRGYLGKTPEWIKQIMGEISAYSRETGFADLRNRPIGIKFFKDKSLVSKDKDVVYSA